MSLALFYGVYIAAVMILVDNVVCDYHFYCQLSHLYEYGIGISILERFHASCNLQLMYFMFQ